MKAQRAIPWPVEAAPPAPPPVVEFSAEGEPVPWRPPRVTRGGQHSYTPAHVRRWQKVVAKAAKAAMAGRPPYPGPVEMRLAFTRPATKARRREVWWAARPDLVNLIKAVEDSMNGIVYLDDAQVVVMSAIKLRGEVAGVRVGVVPAVAVGQREAIR